MAGWKVEVTGLRQILDALGEVDKSAVRRVTDAIARAAKDVAAEASYLTPHDNPVSNWGQWDARGRDLSYSGPAASSGFKMQRNNFRRRGVSAGAGWTVVQSNAGGNIYEVIGDGSRVTSPSGQNLVDSINARYGTRKPRSLFPAYYAGVPEDLAERISDQILDEARKAGLV
ncbi:MAG: hypothetical protein RL134_375 [Actinomycetota bacterium]|jgi:hypothetical protein